MTYIDKQGHLVADTIKELHDFAQTINLKREWFQNKRLPHYDVIGKNKHTLALKCGAKLISAQEIIVHSKQLKQNGI